MLPKDAILLPEVVDHTFVVAIHPTSHGEQEERQRVGHDERLLGRDGEIDLAEPIRLSRPLFRTLWESRRVHLMGSTPWPDEAFVLQVARVLTGADDGVLSGHRILICDRDTKCATFRRTLADVGIRVVQTPFQAPNCNAYAERFVRAIKEECLNQVVVLGEAHLRRTLAEYVAHYHQERNHQGIHDRLIAPKRLTPPGVNGPVRCRARLGGLLRYYYRAA